MYKKGHIKTKQIFSGSSGDSSDKILFGFLAICCLCFLGLAFGFYIGNEEMTETIRTFMSVLSHTESNAHKNHGDWISWVSYPACNISAMSANKFGFLEYESFIRGKLALIWTPSVIWSEQNGKNTVN